MIASVNGISFADYLSAIKNGNQQHASIVFPNQSISLTEGSISDGGINYELMLNSDKNVQLGLTPCATVSMQLLNYNGNLSSIDFTDKFTVSLGVEISNGATPPVYTNTPQQIGVFYGIRPERVHQKVIELTGYDAMILFDKFPAEAFFQQEANGKTLADYFYDLCAFVGVTSKTIGNDAVNKSKYFDYHPTNGVGMTCRDVLGMIAEAMGCYARIAMDGEAEIVSFVDHTSDYTAVRDYQMAEPEIAEYTCNAIDKLQVKSTETDVGVIVGTGTNGYTIIDNPFLYGINDAAIRPYAENLYTKLHAILPVYKPTNVTVFGTWLVEPGDIISIELVGGSTMALPVFNIAFVWHGSANIVYECTGDENRPEMTQENKMRLQEGQKFHNLIISIDELVSEIGDRTGKLTTITQDIDHLELIAQNTAHVFVMLTDPALTEVVNDGDLWVRMEFESWQDVLDDISTWGDLDNGQRTWATIYSEEMYVRKDNRWFKSTSNAETFTNADELRNKYDIQSGIEIEPEGIDIFGAKYLRIRSGAEINVGAGGNLNVKADGNFEVESGGKFTVKSGGDVDIQSGTDVNIESDTFNVESGNLIIDSTNNIFEVVHTSYTTSTRARLGNGLGIIEEISNRGKHGFFLGSNPFNSDLYDNYCGLFLNLDSNGNDMIYVNLNNQLSTGLFFRNSTYGTPDHYNYSYRPALTGYSQDLALLGDSGNRFYAAFVRDVRYYYLTQDSSRAIKHNIQPMPSIGEKLDLLQPSTFVYDEDKDEKTRYGLIYEDTIEVMPEICTGRENDKAINYIELVPMLLKEIQELRARVKALEEREVNANG